MFVCVHSKFVFYTCNLNLKKKRDETIDGTPRVPAEKDYFVVYTCLMNDLVGTKTNGGSESLRPKCNTKRTSRETMLRSEQ